MSFENNPTDKSENKLYQSIWNAIGTVVDPELGITLTDLGLIYELTVQESGVVSVVMTLTSMGCPIGPMLRSQVEEAVMSVEGVQSTNVEIVFSPAWDPRTMATEEGRMLLGIF